VAPTDRHVVAIFQAVGEGLMVCTNDDRVSATSLSFPWKLSSSTQRPQFWRVYTTEFKSRGGL